MACTKRRNYWMPFREAIRAMKPDDLLIWRVKALEVKTAGSRITEFRQSSAAKLAVNFCDNKLFIVRMR